MQELIKWKRVKEIKRMDKKYNREYALGKVKELGHLLKENGIRISAIYLFGSYVNGETDLEWSDIDVAIVSDDFSGFRINDNKMLIPLSVKVEPRIETHPFRIKDFQDSPFVRDEIINKGILVKI